MKMRHVPYAVLLLAVVALLAAAVPQSQEEACRQMEATRHEIGEVERRLGEDLPPDERHNLENHLRVLEEEEDRLRRICEGPQNGGGTVTDGDGGLDKTIVVAIIGAVGGILAALVAALARRGKSQSS